jgi:8-oxo-dGTP diphosphatase
MNILKTIRNVDVGIPSIEPFAVSKERRSVRAVVLVGQKVALMYVANQNFYKLPGGGVEDGEDDTTALERELLEEGGFRVRILSELGEIVEERGEEGFRQKSRGFLVRQEGEVVDPTLTDDELAKGMTMVLADGFDEAIEMVSNAAPDNGGGKFMKARELTFLHKAKNDFDLL